MNYFTVGNNELIDALFQYCNNIGTNPSDVLNLAKKFGRLDYWSVDDDKELFLKTNFYDITLYRNGKISNMRSLEDIERVARPETPFEFLSKASYIMENKDMVRERVLKGQFFQPFGISTDGVFNSRCRAAVRLTKNILRYLKRYGIDAELLIMPADSYAMEVNGYSKDIVDRFICDMEGFCSGGSNPRTNIVRWSKIREDNRGRYEELSRGFSVPIDILQRLQERAQRFSLLSPVASAARYASERYAEARIINEVLEPIKISAADTDVDVLDGTLPRIYPFKMSKFPWKSSKWGD
ncbi:MAG: hypothetical protein HY362_01725 [Candidatus Aenigmarchaeota archaeon]|nr:hypothetical protein [Candidatus Aenigmarchaeota archaeon]